VATPDFYASLCQSRDVLQAVLMSPFADAGTNNGQLTPLLDILNVKGESLSERLFRGMKIIEPRVRARASRRTGLVTLTVRMRDSQLSADVAARIIRLVNDFAVQRLQLRSAVERRFVQQRLQQAESELRAAEDEHLSFLQANRSFRESPLLLFEATRLERRVQVRQEVFLTLTREFEQARIAEVRDTPVLTIVDAPVPPFRRSAPQRRLMVVIGSLLFVLGAAALVLALELGKRIGTPMTEDYLALRDAFGLMWRDWQSWLPGRKLTSTT
jgi:uncharacterized protein involved in exopolysaccharide biosynthesis